MISRPHRRPHRHRGTKLVGMHRTRVAAMAALVPVVVAVMAAVLVAAVAGTAALAVTGVSAGPPSGGFRSEGGNRGWEALGPADVTPPPAA